MHYIRIIVILVSIGYSPNSSGMLSSPTQSGVITVNAPVGITVDLKEAKTASQPTHILHNIATIVHKNFNSEVYQLIAGGDLTIEEAITNAVDHIKEVFATAKLSSREYEQLLAADIAIAQSLEKKRLQSNSIPSEILGTIGTKLCKLLMLRAMQELRQTMQPQQTTALNQFNDLVHKLLDP